VQREPQPLGVPAGAPVARPAPPPRKRLPMADDQPRNERNNDRHGLDTPAGGPLRNQPVLVSDMSAAVEKIRHLQALLQRKTEENRMLRDAVDGVSGKPMSSGALAAGEHKNKRG
jgi:two-component system, OmpR family, phosphate regulon response regulator PhoB